MGRNQRKDKMKEGQWHKPLLCPLCGGRLRLFQHDMGTTVYEHLLQFDCANNENHQWHLEVIDNKRHTAMEHIYDKTRTAP